MKAHRSTTLAALVTFDRSIAVSAIRGAGDKHLFAL
jgi:hypothetical protein